MKLIMFTLLVFTFGCSSIYYNFWETLGQEKRDLLASNLEKTNSTQKDLADDFKDSLERIRSEYSFEEGKLEKTYDELSLDLEKAKDRSQLLSERIEKTTNVAEDLFEEWEDEADELDNKEYKKKSLSKLKATKKKFYATLTQLQKVEASVKPILKKFEDRVIFIKHNLNAKVVGNLRVEFKNIEKDMNSLIAEINSSTKQANSFIKEIE
ncbi:MAG: hypothetical protein CME62_03275 [Halobacteriovoraceae bacterium]|nr:hypothetical protein [Halobacteriovoraceae bacterium]|tara:strand:+ start:7081 stop:7710 length:630 start_codon:yes stop_codon:yes gene_type:complete